MRGLRRLLAFRRHFIEISSGHWIALPFVNLLQLAETACENQRESIDRK